MYQDYLYKDQYCQDKNNYYMDYEGRRRSRTYNLTFQYKFGAYKEKKYIREDSGHDHEGGDGGMDVSY